MANGSLPADQGQDARELIERGQVSVCITGWSTVSEYILIHKTGHGYRETEAGKENKRPVSSEIRTGSLGGWVTG